MRGRTKVRCDDEVAGAKSSRNDFEVAQPDVRVIIIAANGDPDTRRKAMEGDADALLTKPIDFVALRSEIDSRVARAGAEVRQVHRALAAK
jgi:CheY-like chemotaxis protein